MKKKFVFFLKYDIPSNNISKCQSKGLTDQVVATFDKICSPVRNVSASLAYIDCCL